MSASWFDRLDRHGRVDVVAAQAHGALERTGLTASQTERAAWTAVDDVRVGGPRAVGLFLAIAWNTRLPLLVWRVPGLPWLLDRAYELIARNRHRFPGQTPWCIEHPEACEPPPE